MKVKVRRRPSMPAVDALVKHLTGQMTEAQYTRRLIALGKGQLLEHPEVPAKLTPSYHGKECLGNGTWPGYECQCPDCDWFETICFPDYNDSDHKYTYGDHRDFWRPTIRKETCLACKHREHGAELARQFRCNKTKRVGKELRALRCPHFEKDVSNEH